MIETTKELQKKELSDFSIEDIVMLQENISYHSDLYYNKNTSEISDKEYDDLLKKLEKLEDTFSDELDKAGIKKTAGMVWIEVIESTFKKVKHSRPMTSLGNTYNEEDLRDFDERVFKNIWNNHEDVNYVLEFKFDGLGVELIYTDWTLIQAITRWNWIEWEDVTRNIMQIENIPKTINYTKHLEVRGEVVMPISSFNALNEEAKNTWWKRLVLKVDNIGLWQSIGYTQHHPRYCIAYKFPAEILTTDINSVVHQVGRTGTITPVANLEPINIWGAIIRRATLHNYEECEKLWINVWDSVFIKRAWEVIPKIIWLASKAIPPSQPSPLQEEGVEQENGAILSPERGELERGIILPPSHCPSCNTEVIKDEEKVRFYCPNSEDCFEQQKHRLIYAVGKQWLNIDW